MVHIDDFLTQKSNSKFVKSSMREKLLERDHELDLARRWRDHGDEDALDQLVRPYMRLVISTATRFRAYGLPIGDLVQEGNVGLMQASTRFDPERNVRFSTFAMWWIRSAIQDYVLRNWSIVRIGSTASQKMLFFNLRRLNARINSVSAGQTTSENHDQIASELRVPLRDVIAMDARLNGGDQSLNAPLSELGEESWLNFLPDDRPDPENVTIGLRDGELRSTLLKEALVELSPRERQIIRKRRLSEPSMTLEQLGQLMGVSKERVRQLEQRALKKLKVSLSEQVEVPQDLFLSRP